MGVRKKSDSDFKFTENFIQKSLYINFLSPSTKKYEMFNLFVYGWESDYLAITKSNYVYEVEIKISHADFLNDFKHKEDKHLILEGKYTPKFPPYIKKHPYYNINENRPNYFYYAVPNGLIPVEEVPEYAGLIYVNESRRCDIVKVAPKLVKEPTNIDKLNLTNKFYYSYINWRDKYESSNINELKSYIKSLEKQTMDLDNLLSEANGEIDILKNEIKRLKNE